MSVQKNSSHQKKRRRHDAEETRLDLLKAAEEHFAEHGFAAANVRLIAQTADVTTSQINAYFGGKAGLYKAVHLAVAARARVAMGKELTNPARAPLAADALLRFLFDYYEQYPTVPRLVSWWALENGDLLAWPGAAESAPFFYAFLEESQRRGVIRADVRLDLLVAQIDLLSRGWLMLRPIIKGEKGVQARIEFARRGADFLEHTSQALLHGIGPVSREPVS